ncbi:hypothetical protein MRX96_026903 [Rhipicephalus microplus]
MEFNMLSRIYALLHMQFPPVLAAALVSSGFLKGKLSTQFGDSNARVHKRREAVRKSARASRRTQEETPPFRLHDRGFLTALLWRGVPCKHRHCRRASLLKAMRAVGAIGSLL